jgi:hypothetical protein
MAMAEGSFEPADWLYNGTNRVWTAAPDTAWDARWTVGDVTSRLTMLGAAGTQVYGIETYPVDNAVVTPNDPPCQSLCVRRKDDAPFLAVWDAWRGAPNLRSVIAEGGRESLVITTAANVYHVLFGPGETRFADGFEMQTDAALCVVRNADAVTMGGGTQLRLTCPEGTLEIAADAPVSVLAQRRDGSAALDTAAPIQYDTYGGRDHVRDASQVKAVCTGDLWRKGSEGS